MFSRLQRVKENRALERVHAALLIARFLEDDRVRHMELLRMAEHTPVGAMPRDPYAPRRRVVLTAQLMGFLSQLNPVADQRILVVCRMLIEQKPKAELFEAIHRDLLGATSVRLHEESKATHAKLRLIPNQTVGQRIATDVVFARRDDSLAELVPNILPFMKLV